MSALRELSLVIADDHGIVRRGIAAVLTPLFNLRVVAECSNGTEAVRDILAHRPDVAIVDLHLPKLTGLEVVARLREAGSATGLVVLSLVREEAIMPELFRLGANAFLLKNSPSDELLEAINAALEKGQYLPPALKNEQRPDTIDPYALLSRREYEVYAMLVEGVRPRDIARRLEISPKTVDTYRANILRKLEVSGIAGLVRFAIERGVSPPVPQGNTRPE